MTQNIKEKIIKELEKKDFPDLKFLYSKEVLEVAPEILQELLEEEKLDFEKKLKLKNEEISFKIFNEDGILWDFWSYLNHLNSINSSEKIRKIVENFELKITEFTNEVAYNKRFFEMLVYCLENCKLDVEQKKIIFESVKSYKLRWINLDKKFQEKLKKINIKISKLSTNFSNNVLDSEKKFEYFLETDEFLKEFPKSDLENAKTLAEKKTSPQPSPTGEGVIKEYKWWYAFDSSAWSYTSIMKYCSSSKIRKYFSVEFSKFASSWKYDNRKNIIKILKLKNKTAKILWYKNYAELSLEYKMAKSPKEVLNLLEKLNKKAKKKALKEIEEIKKFFNLKKINSWDMSYYSRILKEKKYKLDDKKLKQFFEFENTKKILFETVEKLYWIEIRLLKNVEKYDENIEIYEIYKWEKFISYFIWDYFFNTNKRSWAWADELREKFETKKSIVLNVLNIVKSKNSKTLLTLWEVETLFHEFGHAIHCILSRSKYSSLSGFWVEWDFVELPSQLMEKWALEKETIVNVAKHFETWEKISDDLLLSLENLKNFWTGNFILWQNMYSIIDMMFYSGKKFKNVKSLDKKFLKKVNKLSIFKKNKNYKMYCSFKHIFSGWYSAGYYSYMWADIIVDEIWTEFKKHWVYDKKIAKKFEQKILWAWCLKDAKVMFKDFMWREVKLDAFLEEKGLK